MKKLLFMLLCAAFLSMPAGALTEETPLGELPQVLQGMNPPGSTVEETPLGDVTADAVRQATGADVVILNGGDFAANLQGGEVRPADIQALFYENRNIACLELTEYQLRQWLEHGISATVVGEDERIDPAASSFGGFPQVSGLTLEFDPTAPVGARIRSLSVENAEYPLTVACTDFMAAGGYGYPSMGNAEETAITLTGSMEDYFRGKTITIPEQDRVVCVGTADSSLMAGYPAALFLLVAAIALFQRGRNKDKEVWLDIGK